MDEASFVNLPDSGEHLYQDLDSDLEAIGLVQTSAYFGQVDAHQVHDNQILLAVMDEIVNVGHMLQAYTITEW